MKLMIDSHEIIAQPGQTLLDLVIDLGLRSSSLAKDPIAAKIAGEVFNLNYIPLRRKDVTPERESIRRAMAASDGIVHLLRYGDHAGKQVYIRTAQFALFLAMHELYPGAKTKMSCSVGAGIYFKVSGAVDFSAERLKVRVQTIVDRDIPLIRRRILTEDAIRYYNEHGQEDKAALLAYRESDTLDVYEHEGFSDYYYGEMAPSTGFLRAWDVLPAPDGFLFVLPDNLCPDRVAPYPQLPKITSVYTDGKNWCELMECETVADLNALVDTGRIRELIRVNEALHEKRFSGVADMICERASRAVLLSGPSSSGKTTSANRLATQLRVHGKAPILMSLDDYYLNRDQIAPGPDGKLDLEHINTIDVPLFQQHLAELMAGKEVSLPSFNFAKGMREWRGHKLKLEPNTVIIIEGLHALNPALLPPELDPSLIFKLFVCPLLPLNLDDHNRISASYLRLLRRIVRDFETRNSSVQRTLSMWDSVRQGEMRWIFPFQENADVIFNSSTLYELAVLKKHIFPLLTAVPPEDECYDEVRAIVKILNFVHAADVDDEIPPTSVVREFIGGNTFYK